MPVSVHTRKVIVTAIAKELKFEIEPVVPFQPPEGWETLSPTGKIPAMIHDDLALADSSVICAYLENAYPDRPVYPRDIKELARALWFEEYADGTVFRELVHGLFFQKVIRPNILRERTDVDAIDRILDQSLPKIFRYLETSIVGDWLVAGQFTVADIAVTSNLMNFHYLGYRIDPERYPQLERYFKAQLRHPPIAEALAAEQPAAIAMDLDRSFVSDLATTAA